ncbi:MAG: hypothetical protein AB7V27_19645 [Candidatus Binatia bacterium]
MKRRLVLGDDLRRPLAEQRRQADIRRPYRWGEARVTFEDAAVLCFEPTIRHEIRDPRSHGFAARARLRLIKSLAGRLLPLAPAVAERKRQHAVSIGDRPAAHQPAR